MVKCDEVRLEWDGISAKTNEPSSPCVQNIERGEAIDQPSVLPADSQTPDGGIVKGEVVGSVMYTYCFDGLVDFQFLQSHR